MRKMHQELWKRCAKEFARDYDTKDVQSIHSIDGLSVISIIGQKCLILISHTMP